MPFWKYRRQPSGDTHAGRSSEVEASSVTSFTSVKALVESRFLQGNDAATTRDASSTIDAVVPASGARIAIVDGVPAIAAFALEGVKVSLLSAALSARPELESWVGENARDAYFVALNTASFTEGLLIEIAEGVKLASRSYSFIRAGSVMSVVDAARVSSSRSGRADA